MMANNDELSFTLGQNYWEEYLFRKILF
jgi:hypothetical protein